MPIKESESVKLEPMVTDEIKKNIAAFANSGGGTLYVGVMDNGEAAGLTDADSDMKDINRMIRDGIKPDVTVFIECRIEHIDGRQVIRIDVQSGISRPYFLIGKGIRPDGVFVRHGAATVPATDKEIRKMIVETDGESYEAHRSIEQRLTFESVKIEFSQRNVQFGIFQMASFGLINSDRIYTNLALLLSEQCGHTIKTAVFQDTTQQVFKDRREFGGSLFKQLNDVNEYLDLNNKTTGATSENPLKNETRDYPETALREALFNAVVHREYAVSGSILIKIFSDRMEFLSPGGLFKGIEIEDIMSGYSVSRNSCLAAVFNRLQHIEAYGTGITEIFDAYKSSLAQPKIEVTANVFKMILPNLNIEPVSNTQMTPEENIMQYVFENGSINRKQAERLLGISQTSAGVILRTMVERGDLARQGHSRNIRYFTVSK